MDTKTTITGTAPAERTGQLAGETKTDAATDAPANDLTPTQYVEPSGSMTEDRMRRVADPDHPALDTSPRRNVPPSSYQIDLNDPTLTGQEAVEKNLGLTKA